jgi:DNA-binding NarL/FixJ family response regulator
MSEAGRHPLSDDDVAVVVLVCEGLMNREIATRLEITEPAIALRISRILRRLGLRNRVQLAVWAVKQGLY